MDIGSHDLFMDIHYLALDKGNTGLAEVAKKKADELDDRPTDEDDVSTGPLARPFARSLAPLTRSLTPLTT